VALVAGVRTGRVAAAPPMNPIPKRRNLRAPIKAAVKVIREDGVTQFISDNIGMAGLYIKGGIGRGLRLGPVRLLIRLPNDDSDIEAEGDVVRFEPEEGGAFGRGVRFRNLTEDARRRIESALARFIPGDDQSDSAVENEEK
jgi:hypothetical protein